MFRFKRFYVPAGARTLRYQDFTIHLVAPDELPRDVRGWYGLRASLSKIDSSVVQTFDLPRFVQTAQEAQMLSLQFAKQMIDDRHLPADLL
jgi:hypothetical protein